MELLKVVSIYLHGAQCNGSIFVLLQCVYSYTVILGNIGFIGEYLVHRGILGV